MLIGRYVDKIKVRLLDGGNPPSESCGWQVEGIERLSERSGAALEKKVKPCKHVLVLDQHLVYATQLQFGLGVARLD